MEFAKMLRLPLRAPLDSLQLRTTSSRHRRGIRMAKPGKKSNANSSATGGYEAELWQMADALRVSMDAAEYKKGGEFYTPRCVVKLLVEMLEPYRGRVYDPCCGSARSQGPKWRNC